MLNELKSLIIKPSLHHHSYSHEVCDDTVPNEFSVLCWNVHKNNDTFSFSNYIEEFSKKKFPNMCFIALTATPSDKTLQMFGKEFDLYSMDQAEKEKYILPVSENIITYQTLFELSSDILSN